ncbi:dicarboxylate transporter/tellurite-resistance protein TehA [Haemophilus influenzae]|jgi:C4-dicarboxylate transporter/malic acid transport protein|uniref:Dicarboxylate transporter/tellurite-resistance protein TehA n=3 Tax=Haemophilus influenzae TaxID=727 RepID=A0A346JTT1_HAEIF|nr:tellurite resistance protein [Haemophilus influenzae 86-028NP]AXP39316.1 dicarboxylate transporter/tellurite-resistance protein TehA [Haemophilus influenzae]AXP45505.1 dicarboxylate transporter/tellurite-resistance protein TehA [Haemophilus influenzae]AXP59170.1 dicarboxylate transporter/tellurite-resistance protein TehA [Haemophilus influenzae]AXP62651.1 dicarboxylate transporter/tellurite-resistance protein TehA [Haemophilus influenzae]
MLHFAHIFQNKDHTMNITKPFPLPTGYFGIPLGLAALSLAWFHLENLFPAARMVSDVLGIVASVVWILFILMYAYKLRYYFEEVRAEYHSPVRFSFIALIPITTMLVGDILYRWNPLIAEVLIWIGTIGQLLFSTLRVSELWQGGVFEQKSTHPPFYLPAVAANFTSASSLALLGYHDLAYLFFGAGMIAWIIFEPVLLQHLRISSLEPQFRATIGIVLAPAFVCVSAYLSINHCEVDTLAKILWGYGFLQLFFLLRLFPWIVEKGLNIGLWTFSFGLASMANSATAFYHGNVLQGVSIFAFVFSNVMIGLLVLMTIYKLTKGQFFLK